MADCGIKQKSETAIIPIIIGDEKKAVEVSEKLFENGFFIPAIRYPTVPMGKSRLRVALMASHTKLELYASARLIGNFFRKSE